MDKDIRDIIFEEVYNLMRDDKNVVILSADADAWGLKKIKNDFSDRFINVGVAEQNMTTVAAGLALSGKKVFICSIIPFITLRCFEQIKVNICSMNLPVIILGLGSGLSFSFDGATHHAVCDVSVMRNLPEISIYNPVDEYSCMMSVREAYNSMSPSYIRIDKGGYDKFNRLYDCDFVDGFSIINRGDKTCIISTGILSHEVKEIVDKKLLGHINIHKIKFFSELKILEEIGRYKNIITVEENIIDGGIGTILLEIINKTDLNINFKRIGLPNVQSFICGDRDWLWGYYKIDKKSILDEISKLD